MLLLALLLSAIPQDGKDGVPTPPPPPPPELPQDDKLRDLISKTHACLEDERPAADAAVKATHALKNEVRDAQWIEAKRLVQAYVTTREAGKICIDKLQVAQFGRGVSTNDARIIAWRAQFYNKIWMGQLPKEIDNVARLSGIKSNAETIVGYSD